MVHLDIQNLSSIKRLYNTGKITELANRVCCGEGLVREAEISLLFCDDAFIQELNSHYRNTNEPTDVLAFEQEAPTHSERLLLGDIVISLETVQRFCRGDRTAMRKETMLLFCHGLLHLLGHDHSKASSQRLMMEKQAYYLDLEVEYVWH